MKISKLIFIAILGFILFSCSNSDSNSNADPFFDAEYVPLQDLADLGKETYFYAGFQAGYLRIEDRMSTYFRPKFNKKVYLYFERR